MPVLNQTTPARLTALATAKLPRLALVGLWLAYTLAGLFMRDPWKTNDAVGLATMLTALREGGASWLLPQVGHLAYAQDGPLQTWVGAASIWLFGPFIGEISAGRLPNILYSAIAAASVWYGTYLLGRGRDAQPLALPFGGEPTSRDYGRMLADAALLLLLATVGILQRIHETSDFPTLIAFYSLVFYSWARMLDRPISGALTLALALSCAFLTRGWLGILPVMTASIFVFHPRGPLWPQRRWLLVAALLTTAMILAWWIPASYVSPYWVRNWKLWSESAMGLPDTPTMLPVFRDMSWYLWPTWPLALLALWRWRAWRYAPHILLPGSLLAGGLICLLFVNEPSEADFISIVIPCAILAAFSLPTLRRAVVNTLDWFALMVFSLASATAWLGWVALHFGWPPKIAANIARQTTGYVAHISWLAVFLGLSVTAIWVLLVLWRLHARPAALWRGTVLSAAGLAVTWILLVLLWQPPVDYARSYRVMSGELARAIAANVRPGECVRGVGLGDGQRASLLVFNNLNFTYDTRCTIVLQQTTHSSLKDGTAAYGPASGAQILWQGGRLSDRNEWYRLLRLPTP